MPSGADDFAKTLAAVYRYARGKHGTPQWNPLPHPDNDAAATVTARDSDPLWQHHRGLLTYSGEPQSPDIPTWAKDSPNDYQAVLHSQVEPVTAPEATTLHDALHGPAVDHTTKVPTGMATLAVRRQQDGDTTDSLLTHNAGANVDEGQGDLGFQHPDNRHRYNELFGHSSGRRPWWNAVFPLQDLEWHAAPHDPYRLLAAAVKSGNRHALPPLVDLLKKRDNPAGWSKVWPALAKAMDDRIGDLPAATVLRRVGAIATHSARHSADPEGHRQLAAAAVESQQPTAFAALADHMDENGLPQYAQLTRLELANLEHGMRQQPKRKGGRL